MNRIFFLYCSNIFMTIYYIYMQSPAKQDSYPVNPEQRGALDSKRLKTTYSNLKYEL